MCGQEVEILIRDALIVDGTGAPAQRGDLAVRGGKIAATGPDLGKLCAKQVLDASGLVLTPGFIDVHSHDDLYLLAKPECPEKVLQGVTTEILGNCGLSALEAGAETREHLLGMLGVLCPGASPAPGEMGKGIACYLERIQSLGPALNVGVLVGHSSVRMAVMGMQNRPPTHSELLEMEKLVARAMEQGALGISTGLIYPPGNYAETFELVRLAQVVGRYGGIYATHMRSEGDLQMQALQEALGIGERAGVQVQISHHKVAGKANWGMSRETLSLMEEARRRGLRVACDQYPYEAGCTFLAAVLPPGASAQGIEVLCRNLLDPAWRKETARRLETEDGWENLARGAGLEGIVISVCRNPDFLGKSISQIAQQTQRNPWDVIFDLLAQEGLGCMAVFFMMCEDDISRILGDPWTMVGSDGMPSLGAGRIHPRMSGTFPRILSRYARERKLLSLEEAVRKMTSLAAFTFGLKGKGLLKQGMDADMVLLDPDRVKDRATYQEPHLSPEGIRLVMVNGQVAAKDGELTGARPGKPILRG